MPNPFVSGKFRAFTKDGTAPLAGGKLYAFAAGTDDAKATYTDFTLATANSNPIILDASGEASVWLTGTYKMVLKDKDDVVQWTEDNFQQRYNSIENASVVDYGAVGDGITDDTQAFLDAMADDNGSVFVPAGDYYLTAEIPIENYQQLYGAGDTSRLQFRVDVFNKGSLASSYHTNYNGVVFTGAYAALKDLLIVGANKGIVMRGDGTECVSNLVDNVRVWDAVIGICIDGGDDTNYPTYWNEIRNLLIERPRDMGVYMKHDVGGDTPNANRFRGVRVYSHGQAMLNTRIGFNVDSGRFNNTFIDCEANLHPNFIACMRFGDETGQNHVINFVAEALGGGSGIWMDTGAGDGTDGYMTFINYFHNTSGSSILDTDGEKRYNALNAGYPDRFHFSSQSRFESIIIEKMAMSSRYYDPSPAADTVATDPVSQILSSFNGAYNFDLPVPADAAGQLYFIKKIDNSDNIITVRIDGDTGSGPDNRNWHLSKEGDHLIVYCNGSEWMVLSSNHERRNNRFYDTSVTGATLTDLDPDIFFHLISPLSNTTVTLRAASDASCIGKTVCVKRNFGGGTTMTVQNIEGGYNVSLPSQNDYLTLYSNGADWFIVSERR